MHLFQNKAAYQVAQVNMLIHMMDKAFVIILVCFIFIQILDIVLQNAIKTSHYKFNLKENNVQKIALMPLIINTSINKIKYVYQNVIQIKIIFGCKKMNV